MVYLSRSLCNFLQISKIASKKIGDQVTVRGWVQNVRKMKSDLFVDINDGSCIENLQIITKRNEHPHQQIGVGQSIEINGLLQNSPRQTIELHATTLQLIGDCKLLDGYPFTPKQTHSPDYIRQYIHMRSRVDSMRSLFRIRHKVTKAINDFFDENQFIQIHTPILTTNDCEGAGEVFLVRPENCALLKHMTKENIPLEESYFDRKTFLSVSGQLHLESITHGLGNTYTFAPAFRAENSKSHLHLSEFYMLEAEIAFLDNLNDLTEFIEKLIKTVSSQTLEMCYADIKNCTSKEIDFNWLHKEWPTLTYNEAFDILCKVQSKLKTEVKLNQGFSKEQELYLVEYFNSPVFVINWPKVMKPFYMKQSSINPTEVYAVDLLMPKIGELVGGSVRENNYDLLKNSIPNGLDWYLDLRKYGSIPTGGFGLGFERYLQLITNIHNIRDVIPFPRYPHNCAM